MATFSQWAKTRALRRVIWVCGPEPALVQEVLAACREQAEDAVVLFAGAVPDAEVWDALLACPPRPRLVIVHDAGQLQDVSLMQALASGGSGLLRAVFADAGDDFPRGEGKALAPHLAVLRDSRDGQLIRCCAPSRHEDQLAMVTSWWPGAGQPFARQLLDRCGGDLTRAAEACAKAAAARFPPDARSADLACLSGPRGSFADLLVAGDKPGALEAVRAASRSEVGAGLGLLASRLPALSAIREAAGQSRPGQYVRADGVSRYVLHLLGPYARSYDAGRVRRCRELLALAESAWRAGAGDGVGEAVVCLW